MTQDEDPRTALVGDPGRRQDGAVPPSPEFVMPEPVPAVEQPAAPAPGPTEGAGGPRDPTAEPDAPLERARRPWRQVIAAGLIGVLVGAGLPAAMQGVDRALAAASAERLRHTAMAYLEALADGDADRATAMAPVDGEAPAEAVLRSAERIQEPEVRLTAIDGGAATIEVRYTLGGRSVSRPLEADLVAGEWRLATSLAEAVVVHAPFEALSGVVVEGIVLPSGRALLYPGIYAIDRTVTPVVVSGGERFDVDGDPETVTDVYSSLELTDGIREVASSVAIAHVMACGGDDCDPDAVVEASTVGGPWVQRVDPSTGAVDVVVQLQSRDFGARVRDLQLRALVDGGGAVAAWECAEVLSTEPDFQPCRS